MKGHRAHFEFPASDTEREVQISVHCEV
jgi:hypothetical protein